MTSPREPPIEIDPDAEDIAFPTPFASIPTGDYEVQAVLDVDHSYNYSGRGTQDWVSPVVSLAHWTPGEGAEPALPLTGHAAENPDRAAALAKAKTEAAESGARLEEMESPLLTRFWGDSIELRAWVILPPGYAEHRQEHYPTVYWTHGFGGTIDSGLVTRDADLRPHEGGQDAADDLGDAGRELPAGDA